MAKALIPLSVIANDVVESLRDSTGKHRFSITRHMLDCYRDANIYMDNHLSVKTFVIPVGNVIPMPCDFIYETKVGLLYKGNLAILSLDRGLRYQKATHTQTEDYLNNVWDGQYNGDGYWFYNAFRGDSYLGELYGMGRGVYCQGLYDVDRKDGVIHLGSMVPDGAELVVEYASDGVSDGLKLVPVEMKKMLEYYAKSEWYADRNITQSQINRNNYEREYMRVKRLYNFRDALYMSAKINESFTATNY